MLFFFSIAFWKKNSIIYKKLKDLKTSSPTKDVDLPSCSKFISRPFLKRIFDSQNSDVFSWNEMSGPCNMPPRQRPTAKASERSRSSNQTHVFSSCCSPCPLLSSTVSAKTITCDYDISPYLMKAYTLFRTNQLVTQVDRNYAHLNRILEPLFLVPPPPKD